MKGLLLKIEECIDRGKISAQSPFPPSMKGMPGVDERVKDALDNGVSPEQILDALIKGMATIGDKFSMGKAFVPEMLMSAKAMSAGMAHLKPFFMSGQVKRKGVFVIGTVAGDLHDIGKNLVAMAIEGAGWEVIDLGVDVKTRQFMDAIEKHPLCVVGMSALLTTTMANMEACVKEIRANYPNQKILVGGAPLNTEFCNRIGASFYSANPQGAVSFLSSLVA